MRTKFIFPMVFAALLSGCGPSAEDLLQANIKQMTNLAEMGSVEYTVKKIVKANDVGEWFKIGDRKILFSVTAYLKAGVNLDSLKTDAISIDRAKNSVSLTLPHATLLSMNMPANEIKFEYEELGYFRSSFSAEERNALLKQGEEDIVNDVPNLGIIADAEKNVSDFFSSMLSQMGYEEVTIKFE